MIDEAVGAAPDDDVAAVQLNAARPVAAPVAAEQKDRRQSQRHRYDWCAHVPLVLVSMQRQSGSGLVNVHQAGIRLKAGITASRGGARGELSKAIRHCRPRFGSERVDALVAVPFAVGDPTGTT